MRTTAKILVFGMLPFLSACMGTCNCNDVPPTWSYSVGLEEDEVTDVDSGFAVEGPDFLCTATMTGNRHTISFDLGPGDTCTKTGGAPSSDCMFEQDYEDAGRPVTNAQLVRRATVKLHLDGQDQTYLGSTYFDFDLTCGPGVKPAYSSSAWHDVESFETRVCAE